MPILATITPPTALSGADILTKLLAVDGTGSLLDADFLDAQSGAYYLDLANHTGVLAASLGGTGVSNAGTITNASNTTITGGGTLALAGFTLTVPATGTVGLLGTANAWTAINTFSNTTDASSSTVGGTVVSGGLAVAKGAYIGTELYLPQTTGTTLTVSSTDAAAINCSGGATIAGNINSSGTFRFTNAANTSGYDFGLLGGGGDATAYILNRQTGATLNIGVNNTTGLLVLSSTALTLSTGLTSGITISATTGTTLTVSSTTDATSSTAGSVTMAGGLAVAKGAYIGTFLDVGTTGTFNGLLTANAGLTTASGVASAIMGGGFKLTGEPSGFTGNGVEFSFVTSSNRGAMAAYDRGAAAYRGFDLNALDWTFAVSGAVSFALKANSNVTAGGGTIATTATDGFLYVPNCAGTPTGTPTSLTGFLPIVVDSTNHKLYFYSGGAWRDAGP